MVNSPPSGRERLPVGAVAERRLLPEESHRARSHTRLVASGALVARPPCWSNCTSVSPSAWRRDADPAIREVEEREPRDIAGPHAAGFQLRGRGRDGANRRCVSVLRAHHRSAAGSECSRRKPGAFRQRPPGLDGNAIPLPDAGERRPAEIVARAGRAPCARCAGPVLGFTHMRGVRFRFPGRPK